MNYIRNMKSNLNISSLYHLAFNAQDFNAGVILKITSFTTIN